MRALHSCVVQMALINSEERGSLTPKAAGDRIMRLLLTVNFKNGNVWTQHEADIGMTEGNKGF